MPIELNHTIVYVEDQEAASTFLTELFDLPAASGRSTWSRSTTVCRSTTSAPTSDSPVGEVVEVLASSGVFVSEFETGESRTSNCSMTGRSGGL